MNIDAPVELRCQHRGNVDICTLTIQTMKPITIATAGLAIAFGSGLVHAQAVRLTPQEVAAAFTGKTLQGKTAAGQPLKARFEADFTAHVTAGTVASPGTWRLSDQGYCAAWKALRQGAESCFHVEREGSLLRIFFEDGRLSSEVTP